MSVRTFELNRDGSQTITISQASVGTPMTIILNERMLGTLTTPEELSAGRDFTLDDGSTVSVKVVDQVVQVRRNGLPLFEARSKAAALRHNKVTKRIMRSCASIALVILILGLILYFLLPSDASTVVILLLSGWALTTLIAFLAGVGRAIVNHSWGWVAFGFLPPLVLGNILVVFWLQFFHQFVSAENSIGAVTPFTLLILLTILLVIVAFLFPVVCLLYARSLE